jgi:hypothetical protein
MFEPGATMVSVTIRDTVPMPTAPMVLPVDAVPAPAAAMVNQFDGRCCIKFVRGRLERERGCRRRCRQGYPADKRQG